MKRILALGAVCLISVTGFSQSLNNVAGSAFIEGYDIKGKPFTAKSDENIEGSPYLNESWGTGEVRLANNFLLKKVELRFNLYDNQIYFRKDGNVYSFADPIKECAFEYQDAGNTVPVVLRKGYPEIENHNSNNFYQVLYDGKNIQLLKYIYKRLEEANYTSPGRKQFSTEQEYFVYDAGANKLIRIKADKSSLLKALPQYQDSIEKSLPGKKKISEAQLIACIKTLATA